MFKIFQIYPPIRLTFSLKQVGHQAGVFTLSGRLKNISPEGDK